jgi:6-phosphofructokinase 1
MKRIGVFTSGGDAPGMNAHIRAVTRSGLHKGLEVIGIMRGYSGMIEGDFIDLNRTRTASIISCGGTILKTSRCKEFHTEEGRAKAAERLREAGIEGIVACGGDGTFHGADLLHTEHGIPIVGTPGTIDNDLYGTDYTIGYDTAINTAAQALDKIRDTADSHGRVFFVEVMGRHAGFIAMDVGIACGAEYIAVPEVVTDIDLLYRRITEQGKNKRTIVVIGEGDDAGSATEIAATINEKFTIEAKVTVLGHVQRGGSPTVRDRVLASRLGVAAVNALLEGRSNCMIGEVNNDIAFTSLRETWEKRKSIPPYMAELADILV